VIFTMTDLRTMGTLAKKQRIWGAMARVVRRCGFRRRPLLSALKSAIGPPEVEPRRRRHVCQSVYSARQISQRSAILISWAKDLRRILRSFGCIESRQRGSHLRVECGRCVTTVPVHAGEDIGPGLRRRIERDLEPCLAKGWLKKS
jgi:predicted RNA binding protein YcfA (HicA-like mRNA interferase family)